MQWRTPEPQASCSHQGQDPGKSGGLGLGETDPQSSLGTGTGSRGAAGLALLQRTRLTQAHCWRRTRSYEAAWASRG